MDKSGKGSASDDSGGDEGGSCDKSGPGGSVGVEVKSTTGATFPSETKTLTGRPENPREKRACPEANCDAKVLDLGRHICKMHGHIPEFRVKEILASSKCKAGTAKKRTYVKVHCPIRLCQWEGICPEVHHLVRVHNLSPSEAKEAVKNAVPVDSHP